MASIFRLKPSAEHEHGLASEFDISDYLEGALKRPKDSANGELTAECPSCGKWGKFYVNRESGRYVCFSCEFRGKSIIGLVAQLEGLDWSEARGFVFKRAVKFRRRESMLSLSDRIRLIRPGAEIDEDVAAGPVDFAMPKGVTPVWTEKGGWRLPPYLKDRGIKSKTAKAWGMGYVMGRLWLEFAGRDKPFCLASRLMIPIECPAGRSWTGRDMDSGGIPKYLNPPGADHRRLLIGWSVARLTGDLVICEGPLDAVRLWQHDIAAVALGGKELHDEQLAMLTELSPESSVTVMLDPEEKLAPLNVAQRLSLHFKNIYMAKLPDGVDPGSSSREEAHEAVENSKKWAGGRSPRLAALLDKSRAAIDYRHSRKKS